MRLISFLVYIPLQIAFIPLAIVGVALVGYRQMIVSKKLGISQTTIEVINGRWTCTFSGSAATPPQPILRLNYQTPLSLVCRLPFCHFGRNIKFLENSSYMHESPIRVRGI